MAVRHRGDASSTTAATAAVLRRDADQRAVQGAVAVADPDGALVSRKHTVPSVFG